MAKEKISGIYKITAKHNGKVYIGQSIDIYARWKSHWKQVKRGDSDYLHNAMRKYGKDGFNFEIIEQCSQDIINDRERYWIEFYDSYNNGYNLTIGGEGVKGKIYTDEEKEIIRKRSEKTVSKPILQINKDGIVVNEWRSCKEIGKVTNMSSSSIHNSANHKNGYDMPYGYIWIYKQEYTEKGLNIEQYLSNNREIHYNKIYQLDKNKNIIKVWNSVFDILSENPTYKQSSIYSACNKQKNTMYGFIWMYEIDFINKENFDYKNKTEKAIVQYKYPSREYIATYPSMHEAQRVTGISFKLISRVCRGQRNSTYGYIFEYC